MEDTNVYTENSIRTYTNKVFDLKILDPDSICIEDIAHALSLTPRFGGHLEKMYSVAQHSVMVAINCRENQLAGLLHDASEAYIGDMPSPFKKMMPEYKIIENRLMKVISEKFGFIIPLPAEVKEADRMLLDMEWSAFVLKNYKMEYWTPEEAEKEFLRMFYSLID